MEKLAKSLFELKYSDDPVKNIKKLHTSKFYALPRDDLLKRAFSLPDIISGGGAYFPSVNYSGLSFGVKVTEDYPLLITIKEKVEYEKLYKETNNFN